MVSKIQKKREQDRKRRNEVKHKVQIDDLSRAVSQEFTGRNSQDETRQKSNVPQLHVMAGSGESETAKAEISSRAQVVADNCSQLLVAFQKEPVSCVSTNLEAADKQARLMTDCQPIGKTLSVEVSQEFRMRNSQVETRLKSSVPQPQIKAGSGESETAKAEISSRAQVVADNCSQFLGAAFQKVLVSCVSNNLEAADKQTRLTSECSQLPVDPVLVAASSSASNDAEAVHGNNARLMTECSQLVKPVQRQEALAVSNDSEAADGQASLMANCSQLVDDSSQKLLIAMVSKACEADDDKAQPMVKCKQKFGSFCNKKKFTYCKVKRKKLNRKRYICLKGEGLNRLGTSVLQEAEKVNDEPSGKIVHEAPRELLHVDKSQVVVRNKPISGVLLSTHKDSMESMSGATLNTEKKVIDGLDSTEFSLSEDSVTSNSMLFKANSIDRRGDTFIPATRKTRAFPGPRRRGTGEALVEKNVLNPTFRKLKVFSGMKLKQNVFRLSMRSPAIAHGLACRMKGSRAFTKLKANGILKWCLIARKRLIATFQKAMDGLRTKCKAQLLIGEQYSAWEERSKALLGTQLHSSNQEAYFNATSYRTVSEARALLPVQLVIHKDGRTLNILRNVQSMNGAFQWSCGPVCKVNEINSAKKVEKILRNLSRINVARQAIDFLRNMSECKGRCRYSSKRGHSLHCRDNDGNGAPLVLLENLMPHYPFLRLIVRMLQNLKSLLYQIDDLDFALYNGHLKKLETIVEKAKLSGGEFNVGSVKFVDEVAIVNTYKKSFAAHEKKMLELPKEYCFSCERILPRANLTQLSMMRKSRLNCMWDRVFEHAETKGLSLKFICEYCDGKISKNELPSFCTLNKLEVPAVPPVIQKLNNFERMFIQRAKAFQVVTKSGTVMGKNIPEHNKIPKVVGTTFHLPLPIEETLKRVLKPGQAVMPNQELYILVRGLPTKQKKVWESLVSVTKIFEALQWLKAKNPLYAKIELPSSAETLLDGLEGDDLEDEIDDPDEPDNPVQGDQDDESDLYDSSDFETSDVDDFSDFETGDAENQVFPDSHLINHIVSKNHQKIPEADNLPNISEDDPVQKDSSQSGKPPMDVDDSLKADIPAMLTQLNKDDLFYDNLTIFPVYNKRENVLPRELYQMVKVHGSNLDSRLPKLDAMCFPDLFPFGNNCWDEERRIRLDFSDYIRTRLLSCHPHFRLNIQYIFFLLNQVTLRQLASGIFQVLNITKEKMNAGQFLRKLEDEEFEREMSTIFRRIRNTEEFWKKPRAEILCMIENYGPPTFFLTLSPADYNDKELDDYLCSVNGEAAKNRSTSARIASDPVSVCRYFEQKLKAMLDFLIPRNGKEILAGPIGKIVHYAIRREYQGRGTQHFHILLWVENAPIFGKADAETVCNFIQEHITCTLPDAKSFPELRRKVRDYQNHKHNSYCLRLKKTGAKVCRFSFPRLVTTKFILRDVETAIAGRRNLKANSRLYDLPRTKEEECINDYNPAIMLAWIGNMDIQYIGENSTVIAKYISKYQTKAEKSHVGDVFNDITSTKSVNSRLWNIGLRSLSNRECGALEAADTLLGVSLYRTDPDTTFRWIDVGQLRNRRLKTKAQILQLDPDSTDLFFESVIDDHYPKRPDALANVCLYDYVKDYDIIDAQPQDKRVICYPYYNKFLRKRENPHLIRHWQYDPKAQPDQYFYSLLLLFKPWREIDDLKGEHKNFAEAFQASGNSLANAMQYHEKLTELREAQETVKKLIEEKSNQFQKDDQEKESECVQEPDICAQNEAAEAMKEFRAAAEVIEDQDLSSLESQLNSDQARVYHDVQAALRSDVPLRKFVSGVGGTGKSFVIKVITLWVRQVLKKDVAITAPTGIAAFNINGSTIHRILQLPIEHGKDFKYTRLSDTVLNVLRIALKRTVLIIIDEISMVSSLMLMMIHLRLTEIFDTFDKEGAFFGNINILVFGDLLQLPPVSGGSPFMSLKPEENGRYFETMSNLNLWQELFTYDELQINMRQKNDQSFCKLLANIRVGFCSKENLDILFSRQIPFIGTTPDEVLKEIALLVLSHSQKPLCLLPTKQMCKTLNESVLSLLPTNEIVLNAHDDIDCKQAQKGKAASKLKKLENDDSRTAGLEQTVVIKVGARVMLKRNIDVSKGYVNGAIATVLAVNNDYTGCPGTITLRMKDDDLQLERVDSKFELLPGIFIHRSQFPITLAYGITIHKSQGLSLDACFVDIGNRVFSCGQSYVALSRVKTLEGLHIINLDPKQIKAQKEALLEYNRLRLTVSHLKSMVKLGFKRQINPSVKDVLWAPKNQAVDVVGKTPTPQKSRVLAQFPVFRNEDGKSCYANAVLQGLLSCETARNALRRSGKNNALKAVALQYQFGARLILIADGVRKETASQFTELEQRDAQEFLLAMIKKNETLREMTHFKEVEETECNVCNDKFTQTKDNYILSLAFLASKKKINELMESNFSWTEISESSCEKCSKGRYRSRCLMQHPNNLLIIQLRSWERNDKGQMVKHSEFQLTGLSSTNLTVDGYRYQLHSVIFHHGSDDYSSGHYMAVVRSGKRFILVDDTSVSEYSWRKGSKGAYILIYCRTVTELRDGKQKTKANDKLDPKLPKRKRMDVIGVRKFPPEKKLPNPSSAKVVRTEVSSKKPAAFLRWPAFENVDGVSCYSNASLQCLLSFEPLRFAVVQCARNSALKCVAAEYRPEVTDALSSFYVRSETNARFSTKNQQDAAEFVSELINRNDALKNMTQFVRVEKKTCVSCSFESVNRSNDYILNVPISQNDAQITDLLNGLFLSTPMPDSVCQECRSGHYKEQFDLEHPSNLLIIQLNLWKEEAHGQFVKNTKFRMVALPSTNILIDGHRYRLHSALFHHGDSVEQGHYIAFVRSEGRFIKADDAYISVCNWPKGSKDAYLLFYSKMN